jgi:ubiquinone/menaquinone biosynthesis C-methylase UbiE
VDPKELVARSYDVMHRRYAEWGGGHGGRRRQAIDSVIDLGLVHSGQAALDLGCGTGELATAYLVERGLQVTGIDISAASVAAARSRLPQARFIVADMASVHLPPRTFDLVTAFYSIIHLPRTEHSALFTQIASWLRPGGVFVATLGGSMTESTTSDWLGAPMYWSHFDPTTTTKLVEQSGLDILSTSLDTEIEDGLKVSFLALSARLLAPAIGRAL